MVQLLDLQLLKDTELLSLDVNFPIPFPNKCLGVWVQLRGNVPAYVTIENDFSTTSVGLLKSYGIGCEILAIGR